MRQFNRRVFNGIRGMWHKIVMLWRRWVNRLTQNQRAIASPKKKRDPYLKFRKPLTAADREFLFVQLLDGVHRGWSQAQVAQFIQDFGQGQSSTASSGDRSAQTTSGDALVSWLRQFGDRLLSSPVPNRELATRMVQLGQLNCGKLSEVAGEIGQQLLDREVETEGQLEKVIHKTEKKSSFNLEKCLRLGHEQLDRRQYASASIAFEQATKHAPKNPEVLYGLGLACHRLRLYRQAIAHLSRGLESNPDSAALLTQRGLSYQAIDCGKEAIADFERVVEMKPRSVLDWCARGKALVQLNRQEEAIAAYDEALTIDPTYHRGWHDRGNVLYDLQRYEEAIAAYDRAIELQPNYAAGWFNRGAALGNLQRYREAIAAFDRLLEIQPHDDRGWLCRGQTLERLERSQEAIAAYERALQIRPDDPIAWRHRNQLLEKIKKS